MTVTVRRALAADAEIVSSLGARTFVETFGPLYPPADLEAYLAHAYSLERTQADLADPGKSTWLLEVDGEPVGYALAGPCGLPHPDASPADGELKRMYLLEAHRGGGRGTLLLDTVLAWLERDGPRTLWIGVWSENYGAQRLYERKGFVRVGEYHFPVGQTLDLEFILRRG